MGERSTIGLWDENGSYIGTMCSTYYQQDVADNLDDQSVSSIGDASHVSSHTFSPMPGEFMNSRKSIGGSSVHSDENDNEAFATGHLGYDSKELNELFEHLDKESGKSRKRYIEESERLEELLAR